MNVGTVADVDGRPPNGVITMVSALSSKTHRTLHHADTDEIMVSANRPQNTNNWPLTSEQVPIFEKDTDGTPPKSKYIMGRRNWCSVVYDPSSGDLVWDIRIEIRKGYGQTTG